MGHQVEYECRDEIRAVVIPFYPNRRLYEAFHGPFLGPDGRRDYSKYSVEVQLLNPQIRPIGPFLQRHLR